MLHMCVNYSWQNGTRISGDETPKTPYIASTGEDPPSPVEFTLIAEREPVMKTNDFRKTLIALMGSYYTFNIQYPKEASNTLLFIERYLLGIVSRPRMSSSATQIISAISKL